MNKKIIIASIASLLLVAGASIFAISPSHFEFYAKATNEVNHTITLDKDSTVSFDEESTIISISDYTDYGNKFASDDGYSYLITGSEVRTKGSDYIFETDNAYGGNGGSIFFYLEFNFQLDIDKADEITATMYIKEKHYDNQEDTYYYDGVAQEINASVDAEDEIAIVSFTYTNPTGIYVVKLLSIDFHYSCGY